jgi:hypothetical protein
MRCVRPAEQTPRFRGFHPEPKFTVTHSKNKSLLSFEHDTAMPPMQPQTAVLDVSQWRGPMGCVPRCNTNGIPRTDNR